MAHDVIMPALGMAQDSGLIVAWHKAPGDPVKAGEVLMEVETDKAVMEVEAGADGVLIELRAVAGDDVPVGEVVAVIGREGEAVKPAPAKGSATGDAAKGAAATAPPPTPAADGRILASPKARRLADERGLDLRQLVRAGRPQPYHVSDIEVLAGLPAAAGSPAPQAMRILARARVPAAAFDTFLAWLGTETEVGAGAVLAAFAAGAFRAAMEGEAPAALTIRLAAPREATAFFADPDRAGLARLEPLGTAPGPDLMVSDLTRTRLEHVEFGAAVAPTLSVAREGGMLVATLAAAVGQLDEDAVISCLDGFALRLAEPLRHLL